MKTFLYFYVNHHKTWQYAIVYWNCFHHYCEFSLTEHTLSVDFRSKFYKIVLLVWQRYKHARADQRAAIATEQNRDLSATTKENVTASTLRQQIQLIPVFLANYLKNKINDRVTWTSRFMSKRSLHLYAQRISK